MKRIYLLIGLLAITVVSPVANASADVNSFYFSDFTADYYLTRTDDGTSNLHVKEVLTAVFPETNQNHGITRSIPFTNQEGRNRTIKDIASLNLKASRNGEAEEVSKIVEAGGYYTAYIGIAKEYVHGKQVYTLEYDFTNVITEFTKDNENVSGVENAVKAFQELYWDTNGTGWSQNFDKLTARLHVPSDIYEKMDKQTWCYVGGIRSNNQGRCTTGQLSDGFSFTTNSLTAYENLTFAVQFDPDTFRVVIDKDYILVYPLVAELIIIAIISAKKYLNWKRDAKPQYDLYKSLFDTPQYLPPQNKEINVAEAEQIYIKKTEPSYVATLLELAVSKKVTINKTENDRKYAWTVALNVEPSELTGPQREMINILHGGSGVKKGEEFTIQKHKATSYLAGCARLYGSLAEKKMMKEGFLVENSAKARLISQVAIALAVVIIANALVMCLLGASAVLFSDNYAIMVGGKPLAIIMTIILVVAIFALSILGKKTRTFKKYTVEGIRQAKYLEGLELYITMAEADRLKFLQSVDGADTSNEGIVKLYEKLLPWASLFGAEESWVKELSKYYEIGDVDEAIGADVLNGLISSSISRDIGRAITYSTSYVDSSSSGSLSSGSSGGGGGGFSGGGGGGGGGGGW